MDLLIGLTIVAGISFIPFVIGYWFYNYFEVDTIRLAIFIFVISVSASIWQFASSYNKYPPSNAVTITKGYQSWRESHTPRMYQVSPEGVKSDYHGGLPTIEKKKRGAKNVECLIRKVTTYFIRIFYKADNQRFAIIDKLTMTMEIGQERPSLSSSCDLYPYTGDELKYPYNTIPKDNTLKASLSRGVCEKPASIITRREIEYTTGHKTVEKLKTDCSFI